MGAATGPETMATLRAAILARFDLALNEGQAAQAERADALGRYRDVARSLDAELAAVAGAKPLAQLLAYTRGSCWTWPPSMPRPKACSRKSIPPPVAERGGASIRSEGMSPPEPWKAAEVRVGSHEGAAVLEGNRGVRRVGHELGRGPTLATPLAQQLPMPRPRTHESGRRLSDQLAREGQRLVEGRRAGEDPRARRDAQDPGQHEDGQGKRLGARREGRDPGRVARVLGMTVCSMRIEQDAHVG